MFTFKVILKPVLFIYKKIKYLDYIVLKLDTQQKMGTLFTPSRPTKSHPGRST